MSEEKDQKLICRDCGNEFDFSAGEQQFFASRGFPPPSRCPNCRKQKRQERKDGSFNNAQTSQAPAGNFEIVCSQCGKKTQVPFRPRNPKGVLCAECFDKNNPVK